jgi:hypothetical protein
MTFSSEENLLGKYKVTVNLQKGPLPLQKGKQKNCVSDVKI